ncbi:MAG: hypothetical protein KBB66_11775, partial [Prolixibacteraceae bacterium]|nr:hypothetical protein [Prolixibacteraceae bacterium]
LLQLLVVCRLVRFANVLFCVLAVSIFLSFCSKITTVVGFSSLVPNLRINVILFTRKNGCQTYALF